MAGPEVSSFHDYRKFAIYRVIAEGCDKKAKTKSLKSISAQVSELSHRDEKTRRKPYFEREVAWYREFRDS